MKVVSISFFRHDSSVYEGPGAGTLRGTYFANFLRCLIHAHHAVWEGWSLVIHHDDRVRSLPYFPTLERMHERGLLSLSYQGEARTLCGSMLWRMCPLFDPRVELVVCRDIDSLPMERDRRMVEAFIANPRASIHVIHDSESHSGPLMGGMLAFKGKDFRGRVAEEYANQLPQWERRFDIHGADQVFLNEVIYPAMRDGLLIHTKRANPGCEFLRALPVTPRESLLDRAVNHIGAGYDIDVALSVLAGMDYPHKDLLAQCEA
jgi:hypothetical protein